MTQLMQKDIDKKLDAIWEKNKDRVQENEVGSFVDVDNVTIEDSGVAMDDLKSPGGLSNWRNNSNGRRYFLEGFGRGRSRLFRR